MLHAHQLSKSKHKKIAPTVQKEYHFHIEGMSKKGGEALIRKTLKGLSCVNPTSIHIKRATQNLEVTANEHSSRAIQTALEKIGFTAEYLHEPKMYDLTVKGMTCKGCEKTITNALKALDFVNDESIEVDYKTGSLQVETTMKGKSAEIKEALEKVGFEAHRVEEEAPKPIRRKR